MNYHERKQAATKANRHIRNMIVNVNVIEKAIRNTKLSDETRIGWLSNLRSAMNCDHCEITDVKLDALYLFDLIDDGSIRCEIGQYAEESIENALNRLQNEAEHLTAIFKSTNQHETVQAGWLGRIRRALGMDFLPIANENDTFDSWEGQL